MLTRIICSLLGSFYSVVIFFVSDVICHITEQHITDAFIYLWYAWIKNAYVLMLDIWYTLTLTKCLCTIAAPWFE